MDEFYVDLFSTHINARNKVIALNIRATPVVIYSFGVLSWSITDVQALDRKLRRTVTSRRLLHPNSDIERLYLPSDEGGRGIINLENMYRKEVDTLRNFFTNNNSAVHKTFIEQDKQLSPLNLAGPIPERENYLTSLKAQWTTAYLTSGYLFAETEGALHAIQGSPHQKLQEIHS
nr:unnamed protein product [Callosobruchus analis]